MDYLLLAVHSTLFSCVFRFCSQQMKISAFCRCSLKEEGEEQSLPENSSPHEQLTHEDFQVHMKKINYIQHDVRPW